MRYIEDLVHNSHKFKKKFENLFYDGNYLLVLNPRKNLLKTIHFFGNFDNYMERNFRENATKVLPLKTLKR